MLLFIPWGSCKDSLTHFHSTLRQLTPPQNNCRLRHPHQNRNRNRNQPRRPNLRLYPQFHTHLHRTLTWHHRRMSTGAGAGNPKNNRPIDPLLKRQPPFQPCIPRLLEDNRTIGCAYGGTGDPACDSDPAAHGEEVVRTGAWSNTDYVWVGNSLYAELGACGKGFSSAGLNL